MCECASEGKSKLPRVRERARLRVAVAARIGPTFGTAFRSNFRRGLRPREVCFIILRMYTFWLPGLAAVCGFPYAAALGDSSARRPLCGAMGG